MQTKYGRSANGFRLSVLQFDPALLIPLIVIMILASYIISLLWCHH